LLFASVLNRIGAYRGVAQPGAPDWARTWIQQLRATSVVNILDGETPAYFFWPEEIVALLADAGLTVERLYGCKGVGSHLHEEDLLALMDDPIVWPIWRAALLETWDHPSVAGSTRHMLAIARRDA
jgi:hypothetical protein